MASPVVGDQARQAVPAGQSTPAGRVLSNMSDLPVLRQGALLLGLAASIAIAASVVMWVWEPSFSVLYSNLNEKDLSLVMEALQRDDVQFKVEGSGTILVPGAKVHNLRIRLAADGIPKGMASGFESLQQSQGFGVSQFMETARYQRALEVELARSISTMNNVENTRIHLALPKQSVFLRDRQKPSASVILNLYPGRTLEPGQVAAITHLVSSSIANMEASQVTVVDQRGNLLTDTERDEALQVSRTQLEYNRQLEKDLNDRILTILEPVVGKGAAYAQVTTEVDFTDTEQTQEIYDPEKSALRSSQSTEEQNSAQSNGGIPGALSNEPAVAAPNAPAATPGQGATPSAATSPTNTRRRNIQNFELDRTVSHTRYSVGRLQRLSVAVVIDDKTINDQSGEVTRQSYTPEEIMRLTNLVKETVGFNEQRGDRVTVVNAPFSTPAPLIIDVVPPAFWEAPGFWDQVIKIVGVVLIAGIMWKVFRPALQSLAQPKPVSVASLSASGAGYMMSGGEDNIALNAQFGKQTAERLLEAAGSQADVVKHMATNEPGVVAQVIKSWVAEGG